jgi:O-antigen biosynthesis protein
VPGVCIGIHVHSEPEQLRATLASLRANTEREVDCVLLPDGPDPATTAVLRTLSELTQAGTPAPLGAAACFNRLVTSTDADVLVWLESGAQVGPGWLEHLLAALCAEPHNGLAGPSTNVSWNEQCAFPRSGAAPAEVARTAGEAATRFGKEVRTLEPLYSLADFCYVVRREVIEAIGAADEAYGLGPCWEMDYNIRAARAGWRGVWAGAAYVHRSPFTERRRREESLRFDASKRLYQDKFCGGRLRGEKTDYRSHCRGDGCPNFAPSGLIEIHKPLTARQELLTPLIACPSQSADTEKEANAATVQTDPLVSCIMPTSGRRRFVPHAIRSFLRQDYTNTELLIVDDGADSVADCVPEDPRIRYFRLDGKLTIGAKRNFACEQARGELIIHWDDDDWYPKRRTGVQVRALLEQGAELCGTSRVFYYDAATLQTWEYVYVAGAGWVGGNTLAYRKRFWQQNYFPDLQIGEDSRFVWSANSESICDLADPALCVALIHPGNTSRKETGGAFWQPQPRERIRELLGDELNFYRAINDPPLVSCIMPTSNRRSFVQLALRLFLQQDYPNKELVIVDDGEDAVEDLVSSVAGVSYFRLPGRATIGAKRNLACEQARGEIIAHWDDDDWYSPDRLRYQVAPIIAGEADITGLENAFVMELNSGQFWSTQPALHQRMFVGNVHGGTLVFRKYLFSEGMRYPEINLAEDAWLLHRALRNGKRLLRLSNPGVFVYVRHGTNAWTECVPGRFINPAGWERIAPPANLPAGVIASYQAAGQII